MKKHIKLRELAKKYEIEIDMDKHIYEVLIDIICEQEKRIDGLGKKKKKPGEKTEGAKVWEEYADKFKKIYNIAPVRNAMTNKCCSELVKRLGLLDAVEVVAFYLDQRDAFLVKNTHHIRFCLSQAETLHTKMKSGLQITTQGARKAEMASHNADQTRQYMRSKHGR